MTRPLRTLVICSAVLLASACASSVGGTAEVGPGIVAPQSGAPASSGGSPASSAPASQPAVSSVPDSQPADSSVPESVPQSSAPDSSPPESSAPESSAPESSAPESSSESSTSTATTAPSTSKAVSLPTKLHCAAGALTPKEGTFCYQIPAGFADTSTAATYPGTDKVRTAIQLSNSSGASRDLIFVTSTTLTVDTDQLSDGAIKSLLTKALAENTTSTSTPLVQTSIAGDRAFGTTIKFADGVQQRYEIIFATHTRVSVSCQFQKQQAQITTACASVLKTLQIKNP